MGAEREHLAVPTPLVTCGSWVLFAMGASTWVSPGYLGRVPTGGDGSEPALGPTAGEDWGYLSHGAFLLATLHPWHNAIPGAPVCGPCSLRRHHQVSPCSIALH